MYAVAGLVGQEISVVSCAVSLLLHGFCINTLSDWLKISRHFVIQSEVKPNLIVAPALVFPRFLSATCVCFNCIITWLWFYNTHLKTALDKLIYPNWDCIPKKVNANPKG